MQSAQETIPSDPIILNRPDANSTSSNTTVSPGTSILLLLSAIGSLFVYTTRKKGSRTGWGQSEALKDVPCYKCQFFDNNPYLKCTVHPRIVLSHQAVDCSDYCPRQHYKRPNFRN
jgi:hypothetical protein